MNSPKNYQSGLSIVEALVTMVILLIVMGGVYQIFQSNSLTYRMQQGMSRVQENGRFAMDFVLNDIRMAGYMGCISGVVDNSFLPVEEMNNTNELIIRRALDKRVQILDISPQTNSTSEVTISSNSTIFTPGEHIALNNCESITLTNVVNNLSTDVLLVYNDGSFGPNFIKMNSYGGELMNVGTIIYYVDEGASKSKIPSLFRSGQEIVEGIEEIRFRYGIGEDNVEEYVDATEINNDADKKWENVRSVQIALLVTSPEEIRGMEPDTQPLDLFDEEITIDPNDGRRIRRVFEATIGIRNRLD